MSAIQLIHAEAGSAPTGTGSFRYFTNFTVLAQNIAFAKMVGLWGHDQDLNTWSFFPGAFSRSVTGNMEIWQGGINETQIDQFVVEYGVSGQIFWDNNGEFNYVLATGPAHTDGIGTSVLGPNVFVADWDLDPVGNLSVEILVQDIAFAKQVAIVYTTNNWATFQNAFATFQQAFAPSSMPRQIQVELWKVDVSVGVGKTGQFAAFYIVEGNTYWDNNFTSNYTFS